MMSSIRRCEAGTFLKMCMPLRSAADRTNGSGLLSCSSTGPSALAPYFSKPRLAIPPWSSRPPGLVWPYEECLLTQLVPKNARTEQVPCTHFPLSPAGQTIDSLYPTGPSRRLRKSSAPGAGQP